MSNTGIILKKQEFNSIYDTTIQTFVDAVHQFSVNNRYGIINSSNKIENIKLLFIYMNVMWSWEQDQFINDSYPNYVNSYMIRAILSDLRELI